jgi:hypothetical protein
MPMKENEKTANLLKLMQMLKYRLHAQGKAKTTSFLGNVEYIDSDIYTTEMLMIFLEMSLCDFNMVPYFTFYSFEDSEAINHFATMIVEGAVIYALGSQALIERGREFTTTNSGINFDPPNVSELLQTQYAQLYQEHWERLKYIKSHIHTFKK